MRKSKGRIARVGSEDKRRSFASPVQKTKAKGRPTRGSQAQRMTASNRNKAGQGHK
jgi:hypothetical protein